MSLKLLLLQHVVSGHLIEYNDYDGSEIVQRVL